MSKPRIFLGLPTYDGTRLNSAAIIGLAQARLNVTCSEIACSLLARGFNMLYCMALNEKSFTHFAMIHADVKPLQADWLRIMYEEMERVQCDVLSAVIPLKHGSGLTSTATESDNVWEPRKLSLREVYDRKETWTEPGLLVNTGLLLVRLTDKTRQLYFNITDRIVQREDGTLDAVSIPEDWGFSRQCWTLGVEPYATTKVKLLHVGRAAFENYLSRKEEQRA